MHRLSASFTMPPTRRACSILRLSVCGPHCPVVANKYNSNLIFTLLFSGFRKTLQWQVWNGHRVRLSAFSGTFNTVCSNYQNRHCKYHCVEHSNGNLKYVLGRQDLVSVMQGMQIDNQNVIVVQTCLFERTSYTIAEEWTRSSRLAVGHDYPPKTQTLYLPVDVHYWTRSPHRARWRDLP